MASRRGSSRKHEAPRFDVDDRLVMPERRFEVIDGEVVHVSPADQPHGSRHSKLSALLEAYVAEGYDAASDMLTRTSEKGDMAPDGSIYPAELDPQTGGRKLEELAFEVVSTETLGAAAKKAAALSGRGVRRVFALDVQRRRVLEWSKGTGAWQMLRADTHITDPVLVASLPVHDLVSAARADDAVARALLAKQNPVLVKAITEGKAEGRAEGKAEGRAEGKAEGRAEGKAEGRAEGKAEAIATVLAARGIPVSASVAARIRGTRELATLERWLERAATCRSTADLFEPKRASKKRASTPAPRKRRK